MANNDRQRLRDLPTTEPVSTGSLTLIPIDGSIERQPLKVDIELTRVDGVLVLGDLRQAAERFHDEGNHEVAHRLWTVVEEAARRADAPALVVKAAAMAEGSLAESRAAADNKRAARRGVSYDYQALAADRETGLSQAETAAKWGCSAGTVARAVRYVRQRDELADLHSDLGPRIHRGGSVDELAAYFDVPSKIMRWIVSDYWDRRS